MAEDYGPMLDTVTMTTEALAAGDYASIQEQLQLRTGVQMATGEEKYARYVATMAVPSTGAQLRFTVETAKWVKLPGERQPYKVLGMKSLRVEGSIHKAMHGHNVYGGPVEPQAALSWLVNLVAAMLSCPMPDLDKWYIRRLDVAESFDLGSLENVRGWIRAKSLVVYPRRTVHFWGDSGFIAEGTTTTLRAYAKGIQFHAEGGYKSLLQCRDASYAFEVARLAERTLRCEVEIKPPIWDKREDTGRADTITREWLQQEMYHGQWRKFLRPIDSDSRMVHTAVEVEARLRSVYDDPGRVLNLYLVWCVLAIRGEGWYRTQVAGSTWRRQRAALEKAYISWESTNVLTIDCPGQLQNFFPGLDASERLTEVLPLIDRATA
jgi:hypothetical protein